MRRADVPMLLVLALAGAVLLVSGVAVAQSLHEPLTQKLNAETDQLAADPTAYLADQATESGLAEDANWTIAYACFAAHEAALAAGQSVPPNDLCAGYASALGISEPPPQAEDEAVAVAEELEDDATREAQVIAEAAAVAIADVLDDPNTALDTLLGLVDAVLASVLRAVSALGDAADVIEEALDVLGEAAAMTVAAPVLGLAWLFGVGIDAGAATVQGIAQVATGLADRATDAARSVASGTQSAWSQFVQALVNLVGGDTGDVASTADDFVADGGVPLPSDGILGSTVDETISRLA